MNPMSTLARWRPAALPSIPPAVLKTLAPLLTLAIAVTAAVMLYLWQDQSSYKPVFGAHEKIAVTDMMNVLDSEHVPYRVHPDSGQVLVPDAMLGKVRMMLAAKGVTAQLPAGLELMDKNDPLGVSQFVQDVRFRRGLEGELAQSIMTLDAISAARVHLAIAKSSSFIASDGEKSSASVVLGVKPGRTLAPEQIAAIVNMVAGSVASLAPQRVSLIDQAGNYLSAHVDLTEGYDAASTGNEAQKRVQDDTRRNVIGLLGPVLGENNFKLSVTAAVNNDRVDETVEKFGEAPKVTSEATREEQDKKSMMMGVPGTLSNRPPTAAPAAAAGANNTTSTTGAPAPADDSTARKNATSRQYAYDRSITQTKHSRGRLEKLSVAVVLNNASAPTPKTGWSAAELANIDKMLRTGLGIDTNRGDLLAVSAMAFPAPPAPVVWWQERDNVLDISKYALWLVGLVFTFLLIVRPLLRAFNAKLAPAQRRDAQLLPGAQATAATPVANGAAGQPGQSQPQALAGPNGLALPGVTPAAGGLLPVVPLLENYDLPPTGSSVDVMVDHLKVLAGKEPERVAEVVKQWMQKNGRAH